MITISELSAPALGFLAIWQLLLFLGSVWYLVIRFREKRRSDPFLRCTPVFLLIVFNYLAFQFTADMISKKGVKPWVIRIEQFYADAPVLPVLAACLLISAAEFFLLRASLRWYGTHITSGSIKEAIETLPVGICAYEDSGKITLKNTTMEQLCRRLTGMALLNGNEFALALDEEKAGLLEGTVELPDFGAWSFEKSRVRDKKHDYALIVAYNVTEAYRKTQTLNEKRRTVERLNGKLTEYNRRIETVTAEKERLSAKIKIHDRLGEDMLVMKHYLLNHGDEREREEILRRAERNVSFLLEKDEAEKDEYEVVLKTAAALGVTVTVEGTLPPFEPAKHVIATAMHECLTNTLRHAHGDRMRIRVAGTEETAEVSITNNGDPPTGEIREKGGLLTLRTLAEKAGGTMRVEADPRFMLTVTVPKEEYEYGL